MMKLFVFLLAFFSMSTTVVSASAVSQAEPIVNLIERLRSLQSFSGNFQQQQLDESGAILQRQTGKFHIAPPGKIRWETIDPMPQLLVSDGATYWLYDADLEQVTISAVSESISQTPALLFSGDQEALSSRYAVVNDSDNTYILSALSEENLFEQIVLVFSREAITSMTMTDRLGQKTVFQFSSVIPNGNLSETLFEFSPPENVDIIYQ